MNLLAAAVVLVAAVAVAVVHIDPVVGILVAVADIPAAAVGNPAVAVGILAAVADSPVAAAVGIVVAVDADLVVGIALVGLEDCNHTY